MDPRYRFSADRSELDVDLIHQWLSEQAYWAEGRPRDVQERAIEGSRNFGIYDDEAGRQVAYARVVTDGATFAWLCDVFVDPDHRGEGIGTALVDGVIAHLEPLGLRRILLATRDAHSLYAASGFGPLPEPGRWMVRTTDLSGRG